MLNILIHHAAPALDAWGSIDVPKDAKPFVEKRRIRGGHRQLRRGQVVRQLGITVVFGVGVHGIIAVHGVAVFATASGVLVDVDLLVAVEEGAGTLVHLVSEEILVDICVENAALVFTGLLLPCRSCSGNLRIHSAIIHHGHRCAANWATHGRHVCHSDVGIHDCWKYRRKFDRFYREGKNSKNARYQAKLV